LKQCRGDRAFEQALQRLSPQQLERQGEAKAAPRPMSSTSARPPRNEMPAPPEAPLVGDGNELSRRRAPGDGPFVPRHVDIECRAEGVVRQRRSAARSRRQEKEYGREGRAFSHSFHSPCSWAAPSRWNRMVEGALGPIAVFLSCGMGTSTMLSCSQVARMRVCSGFLGCGSSRLKTESRK
jgi:hypothetical protein